MQKYAMKLENKLGFEKSYAVVRDAAKKAAYYGRRIDTLSSNTFRHYFPEGSIEIRVLDNAVDVVTHSAPQSSTGWHKNRIDIVTKPFRNMLLAENITPYPSKIFGTGLSRTGTTSLHTALQLLGIFGIDHAPYLFPAITSNVGVLTGMKEYDAFTDSPFSYFFKELDKSFPNSKFIHTTRDADDWLESFRWLIGNSSTPMSRWFYGVDKFDEEVYLRRFVQHERDVLDHFANRPHDLIVIKLRCNTNWDQLCRFLNTPTPEVAYPFVNKRQGRESGINNLTPPI